MSISRAVALLTGLVVSVALGDAFLVGSIYGSDLVTYLQA